MNCDKEANKIMSNIMRLGYTEESDIYLSKCLSKIYAKGEEQGFTNGLKAALKIQTFMRKRKYENLHSA